jgi:hypothetical protein
MAKVTIDDVARSAWESTRPDSAPTYANLTPEYRAKLIERAEQAIEGQYHEPSDLFATQVCQLADGRGRMQIGSEKGD